MERASNAKLIKIFNKTSFSLCLSSPTFDSLHPLKWRATMDKYNFVHFIIIFSIKIRIHAIFKCLANVGLIWCCHKIAFELKFKLLKFILITSPMWNAFKKENEKCMKWFQLLRNPVIATNSVNIISYVSQQSECVFRKSEMVAAAVVHVLDAGEM